MRIGFTGTQQGMSRFQAVQFRQLITSLGVTHLHHGDCVGADEQADGIARLLGVEIIIHPPDDPSKRAFCAQTGDIVWRPLPYLERNHDIVEESELLIAAPRGDQEQLRSGTWATVRYARKLLRSVVILPRGTE